MFHVPDKYRLKTGLMGSSKGYGNNGMFFVPFRRRNLPNGQLKIVASDGEGWEHVSVSIPYRCPKWGEMCQIKNLFWDMEDAVIQIHPPNFDYVNNHPFCLHLWRKAGTNDFYEAPPTILVGIKT